MFFAKKMKLYQKNPKNHRFPHMAAWPSQLAMPSGHVWKTLFFFVVLLVQFHVFCKKHWFYWYSTAFWVDFREKQVKGQVSGNTD